LATYLEIENSKLEYLWSLSDSDFRIEFFEFENNSILPRLDIDKIWDTLHCTLTGVSASYPIEGNKFSEGIVGIYPKIYDDEDYSVFVSIVDNADIQSILSEFRKIGYSFLDSKYSKDNLEKAGVYPFGIWREPKEQVVSEMGIM